MPRGGKGCRQDGDNERDRNQKHRGNLFGLYLLHKDRMNDR